jgi:hypothetical protein
VNNITDVTSTKLKLFSFLAFCVVGPFVENGKEMDHTALETAKPPTAGADASEI